jgi:hypothetical protein
MTDHVSTQRALYLTALAPDDPEQVALRAHGEQCADCRRHVLEAELLLHLLDASEPAFTPSPELRQRVKTAVFGDARRAPAPAGSARSAAAAGLWPGLARLLAARWAPLHLLLSVAASVCLVWLDARPEGALHAALGAHCALFESGYALAGLLLGAVWARSRRRAIDASQGAVAGMLGALFGQLLLRTHCDASHALPHLLAFHLLGVLIGSALGALGARGIARMR